MCTGNLKKLQLGGHDSLLQVDKTPIYRVKFASSLYMSRCQNLINSAGPRYSLVVAGSFPPAGPHEVH